MAKKKKKNGGKPRLVNRLINAGLLLLAFSPAIATALAPPGNAPKNIAPRLLEIYTGFDRAGNFVSTRLIEGYAPVVAAFVLFEVKKHAMRKFRV